jgi:hypothetical protein
MRCSGSIGLATLAVVLASSLADPARALGPDLRIEPNLHDARFGETMASAGDVNDDGLEDLIVGATLWSEGQSNEGAIFVFLGRPEGLSTGTVEQADAKIQSNLADARLGTSVASAGDVNGDGYGDIVFGAGGWDGGQDDEGAAWVVLGGPLGIPSGGLEVAATTLQGDWVGARLGTTVAGADVNGDGYSDVVTGGRLYQSDTTTLQEGYALIFLGGEDGVPSGGLATADTLLQSNRCGGYFGDGLDAVGDVNNDGYEDIVVGAPRYTGSRTTCQPPPPPNDVREGAALLYLGSAAGIPDGDWTTADQIIEGQQIDGRFGREISGVGDLNGDDYDDVAIGATQYDHGQQNEGAVFIFHGSAAGLGNAAGTPATGPDGAVAELQGDQFDDDNGSVVVREHFGWAVDSGDWDGDGHIDLMVSSPYYDAGQTDEGASFLFRGSATGIASGSASTPSRRFESNVAEAWAGSSVALVDVDGDGRAEAFMGANRMGYPVFPPDPEGSEGMVLGFPHETVCENELDDDGDGPIDLTDAGCVDADDLREEVDYSSGATNTITTAIADDLLSRDQSSGAPTTVVLGAGGSTTRDLVATEGSAVRLDGGAVAGDLVARDGASAEILDGSVAGSVVARGDAVIVIRGGSVVAIEARDDARVEVYGDFQLPDGEVAATSGTLVGTLEDATPISATFERDAGATILLVPEPGSSALALAAAAAIAAARRARSRAR